MVGLHLKMAGQRWLSSKVWPAEYIFRSGTFIKLLLIFVFTNTNPWESMWHYFRLQKCYEGPVAKHGHCLSSVSSAASWLRLIRQCRSHRLLWLREMPGKPGIQGCGKQVIIQSCLWRKARTSQGRLGEKAVCNEDNLITFFSLRNEALMSKNSKSAFPGREVPAAALLWKVQLPQHYLISYTILTDDLVTAELRLQCSSEKSCCPNSSSSLELVYSAGRWQAAGISKSPVSLFILESSNIPLWRNGSERRELFTNIKWRVWSQSLSDFLKHAI